MQTGHARDIHIGDHHDRRGVVALAVLAGVLVVAVVVVALVLAGKGPVEPERASRGTTTSGSSPDPSPGPFADGAPVREVVLRPKTGIDVESDATTGHRADGADGGLDLHLDELNLLRPATGGFVQVSGSTASHGHCAKAVTSDDGEAQIFTIVGQQHCFVTSGGNIAWLRVKRSTLLDPLDARVVFDVVVWKD